MSSDQILICISSLDNKFLHGINNWKWFFCLFCSLPDIIICQLSSQQNMRGLKSTIVSTNKLMKLVHFPEQPPVTTCRRIPGKYSTLIQIFIVFVFMMNFAIGDAICVGLSTLAKRAGLIGFVLQQLALFCKVLCYCALFCTALYCFARFCTILNWVCFATVPIFLGLCHQRLVCTSCST